MPNLQSCAWCPRHLILAFLGIAVTCSTIPAHAQAPAAQSDLIESAAVVMTFNREAIDNLKPDQIEIRIDNGKSIHPTTVRREGDEPLNIAFMIDASRDPFNDLKDLSPHLAALIPKAIHPTDTVSVYALDCTMARTLDNASADPATLKDAADKALAYPKLHGGAAKPACGKTVHLLDDVTYATTALSKLPGRRVLILVSTGQDFGSKNDWAAVRAYAYTNSVAIFALRDNKMHEIDKQVDTYTQNHPIGPERSNPTVSVRFDTEQKAPLDLLCIATGGLTINTKAIELQVSLDELLTIVRNRYILQFPRGNYSPQGAHGVKITTRSKEFVSSAGPNNSTQ